MSKPKSNFRYLKYLIPKHLEVLKAYQVFISQTLHKYKTVKSSFIHARHPSVNAFMLCGFFKRTYLQRHRAFIMSAVSV